MPCRALVCRVYVLLGVCREEMSAIEQSWALLSQWSIAMEFGVVDSKRWWFAYSDQKRWFAESQVYDVSGEGWLGLRADQSVMELWQCPG